MSDEHDDETRWDLTQPIDMTEVHADDQFIEALSADRPVPTRDDTEYQLAELLSGWRHEVVAEPVPQMPDVDEVEAAIAATERARRGRGVVRHLRIASGVAAVVVVAGAGLTVLSQNSSPGDPLWNVKRVVFASAATQTQASIDVQANLEKAEAAVAAGNTTEAQALIAQAQQDLKPVNDGDTRNRMKDWISRLQGATGTTSPSTTADTGATTTPTAGRTGTTGPSTPPKDLRRFRQHGGSTSVTVPTRPGSTDQWPGGPGRDDRHSGGPGNPDRRDMRLPQTSQPQPSQPQTSQPQPPVTTTVPVPTTITTTETPTPATTLIPTTPNGNGPGGNHGGGNYGGGQQLPQPGPITTTPLPWPPPRG